ncbi:MAG: hypothetical protein AB7P35_18330 [Hyphomonadaceae bacterium]
MRFAPVNPEIRANKRIILASFIAGVSAMVLMGLIAPVMATGGFELASAEARSLAQRAPVIEPLDVAAIDRTLAEAEAAMAASRAITDGTISRLDSLAH